MLSNNSFSRLNFDFIHLINEKETQVKSETNLFDSKLLLKVMICSKLDAKVFE